MFDKQLVLHTLRMIEESLLTVTRRTDDVLSVNDFLRTDAGMILLDSTCMKLIAIGESVKNLDKISNKELLVQYPSVPWKDVMGLRDIIAHHYFDIDAEEIFRTIKEDIPFLTTNIRQMIKDLT